VHVALVVGGVDHRRGMFQKRDLIDRLEAPSPLHQLLTILDVESLAFERLDHRYLGGVNPDGVLVEAAIAQDVRDSLGVALLHADILGDRPAPGGDAGAPTLSGSTKASDTCTSFAMRVLPPTQMCDVSLVRPTMSDQQSVRSVLGHRGR
jgi:hypothetical protein